MIHEKHGHWMAFKNSYPLQHIECVGDAPEVEPFIPRDSNGTPLTKEQIKEDKHLFDASGGYAHTRSEVSNWT